MEKVSVDYIQLNMAYFFGFQLQWLVYADAHSYRPTHDLA